MENIYIRNIKVGEVREAVIKINCLYEPQEGPGDFPPLVQNVHISDITSQKAERAIDMSGIKNLNCINNIYITICEFEAVEQKVRIQEAGKVVLNNIKINRKLVKRSL